MEDIYIIISKYLLGTASPQEEKEIMEPGMLMPGTNRNFRNCARAGR